MVPEEHSQRGARDDDDDDGLGPDFELPPMSAELALR